MAIFSSIRQHFDNSDLGVAYQRRFERWMSRRLPPQRQVTLTQKRIFIMPNRAGAGFGLLLFVMLMGAINYENSLIFALTFWLASLFVVAILHTYSNLSGLTLELVRITPAHAGDQVLVELRLLAGERDREMLRLGWPEGSQEQLTIRRENREQRIKLYLPSNRRGRFRPGRLRIESSFPLGILTAWSWVDFNAETLVYPKPMAAGLIPTSMTQDGSGEQSQMLGDEEFIGLRNYRPGDSLKHLSWKQLSKGKGLLTKEYAAYADQRVWLDWDFLDGNHLENRLSLLCDWVLQCSKKGDEYGLRLPGRVVDPSQGDKHRTEVLEILALYGDTP